MNFKSITEFYKKYDEIISYVIISAFLLLSCFFEPVVYVTVAVCVLISAFLSFDKILHIILFNLSFELVFSLKNGFPIFNLMWMLLTFVAGVKYLIEVSKQKRKLNHKTLIPILLFLLFLILPIHEVSIISFAVYAAVFVLIYLAYEYRAELSLKQIVLALALGIIVSSLFFLTKFTSLRMKELIPTVYPIANCKFARFSALAFHPNSFGIVCLITMSFLMAVLYKKQINLFYFLILFTLLFVLGYLSLSRDFIIAFAILFIIFVFLYLIKNRKKAFKPVGLLSLVIVCVCACCFLPTKIYLIRFNILPNTFNETQVIYPSTDSFIEIGTEEKNEKWWSKVYNGEIRYDPGRVVLWKLYLKNWSGSLKSIFFGRGISANLIGQMAAHNSYIQSLWNHGILGWILLLLIALAFIDFKKLKEQARVLCLVLPPILCCTFMEALSHIPKLAILIALITLCELNEKNFCPEGIMMKKNNQSCEKKRNIVFVMPEKTLPVPAINGGAVETLLTHLIEENENHEEYIFHIIMMKDEKDRQTDFNYHYKNTCFYNYYMDSNILGRSSFMFKSLREIRMITQIHCPYDDFITETVKCISPDLVVYEGRYNASVEAVEKIVGRRKMAFHIHHQILRKDDFSKYFSNALCVSQFVKDDWINNKKFKNQVNFEVLPNIVDKYQFNKSFSNQQKIELREKLGLKKEDFIVLFVGRLVKVKGIEQLIVAIQKIENNNVKLLIVGESMFKNSKKTKFTKHLANMCIGWENRIKFTGFINNQELYKYYNIADVHVIPSMWEEAAGLVALESKIIGIPQIVTNSGGLVEYASKSAIVLDKNDKNFVQNLANAILAISKHEGANLKDKSVLSKLDYYNIFSSILHNMGVGHE